MFLLLLFFIVLVMRKGTRKTTNAISELLMHKKGTTKKVIDANSMTKCSTKKNNLRTCKKVHTGKKAL